MRAAWAALAALHLLPGLAAVLAPGWFAAERLGGAVVPSLVLQALLIGAALTGSRASAGGPLARTPPSARAATPR